MKNVFFPDEEISENDLYFVCSMIERTARNIKQPNRYVVNRMGKKGLEEKLSVANVLHSDNPEAVSRQWIEEYELEPGDFDVTRVNPELVTTIPTALQMGKVYMPSFCPLPFIRKIMPTLYCVSTIILFVR